MFDDLINRESPFLEWRTRFGQSFLRSLDASDEESLAESLATSAMIQKSSEYQAAGLFSPSVPETRYLDQSTKYRMIERGQLHETLFPPGLQVLL